MKDKIESDNIFKKINIDVLLFNSRNLIHIPSFRIVNLLCCRDYFSDIIFIDGKTKYRSHYLLNVSWPNL